MPRGRKPKSVKAHKDAGTYRADRHKPKVKAPEKLGRPRPPRDFTASEKRAWKELLDALEGSGVDQLDVPLLEAGAAFLARARDARAHVNEHGITTAGHRGEVTNPAIRIERESWHQFRQIAEALGLSPTARARLGIANTKRKRMVEELEAKIGVAPRRLRAVKDDDSD